VRSAIGWNHRFRADRGRGQWDVLLVKKTLEERQSEMRDRQTEKPKAESTSEATRFQPGVSQNPGPGRPRSPLPLTAGPLVRQKLAEINSADPRKRQRIDHIIETLFAIATNPKAPTACTKAAEVLLDRAWGKPVQSIEQTVTF